MSGSEGLRLYEMLTQAFVSEGVDTLFTLMGDGNMVQLAIIMVLLGIERLLRGKED